MRVLFATLLIFATVVFLSSALPQDKGEGKPGKLVENAKDHVKALQRKKPPMKIPGPKLTAREENPGPSVFFPEMKKLSDGHKDDDREKPKEENIVNEEKHNVNLKEETQEGRSSAL